MTNQKHWLQNFVENNFIKLASLLILSIVGVALLRQDIVETNVRVDAMEKIGDERHGEFTQFKSEYPSADYFDLKFDLINDNFEDIEKALLLLNKNQ